MSSLPQVSLGYLTSLHNDERVNHQLDVKFQKLYLKKVCTLLRCSLREGAVGSRDPAEHVGCADFEDDKIQEPTDVGEGELPDSHGECFVFVIPESNLYYCHILE